MEINVVRARGRKKSEQSSLGFVVVNVFHGISITHNVPRLGEKEPRGPLTGLLVGKNTNPRLILTIDLIRISDCALGNVF